ncbi:MAG: hypothetical protein LBJ72_07495 [Dysgonamonadaceae bacterium]|jgi:hypothetical protein|nr:hypothetical protein [Dysgonamonadaceae bacterium]
MRKLRLILLFPFTLLLIAVAACTDDFEDYTTGANDILAFSKDTVAFDTILSTIVTPTGGFIVYNNNSKPLLISSINLSKGDASNFNIVIDGQTGNYFENIEVGAKDSIYVFVNARLDENGAVIPVLYEDQILFQTNGVQQKVVLEAYGQDVYIWKGRVIDESGTLPNDKPYLIYDSLEIKEGVTLTIQEGTTFYMHQNSGIKIYGTLNVKGSPGRRVVFRGDRMDNDYMVNIPYDRVPGQWGGFRFYETSFNNEFESVYIRNGSYGLIFETSTAEQSKLKIKNSIITNMKGVLISADNCRIEGDNCEFSNSQHHLLSLAGGKYRFSQCTMANYYPSTQQWGTSGNQTIYLTNEIVEMDAVTENIVYKPAPLEQADFTNCIIYGPNSKAGINLSKDTVHNPATVYNYNFLNCLVLYDETKPKAQFVDCIFNKDPKFLNIKLTDTDSKSIPYDFRLDSISPARNVANQEAARRIPDDMNGISRFMDDGPDIGAYEYIKNEKNEIQK